MSRRFNDPHEVDGAASVVDQGLLQRDIDRRKPAEERLGEVRDVRRPSGGLPRERSDDAEEVADSVYGFARDDGETLIGDRDLTRAFRDVPFETGTCAL